MKHPKFRQTAYELTFLLVLTLGLFAFTQAQTSHNNSDQKQKTVRVEVEVTENGTTTTSIQEMHFDEASIQGELQKMVREIEMILDDAVNDGDETDLEIIIRKNTYGMTSEEDESPHYRSFISVIPEAAGCDSMRLNDVSYSYQYEFESELEESSHRGFLGIVGKSTEDGVIISKVFTGTTAESMGLQVGDLITKLDGHKIEGIGELVDHLNQLEAGNE